MKHVLSLRYSASRIVITVLSIFLAGVLELSAHSLTIRRDGCIRNPQAKGPKSPALHAQKATEKKPGTNSNLVIYMAGDGNLDEYVDLSLKQLEREGAPANLNVILCICTHRANEPKMGVIAQVRNNKTVVLEKIPNMDSGDKKSLLRACISTIRRFGKGDFHLVLWDHGYGPTNYMSKRGICYDATTGNFLTDRDLHDVCAAVKKELGKNISMLGCDACLMACNEISYALKDSVDYLLASEQTIPAFGWPYHLFLRAYKTTSGNTEEWGKAQVNSYRDYYDLITQDYALSFINLKKLDGLFLNLQEVAAILNELIKTQKGIGVLSMLRTAGRKAVRFEEESYADLFDWYQQVLLASATLSTQNNSEAAQLVNRLRKALSWGTALINQAVVSTVQGRKLARAHGIFAYIPQKQVDRTYKNCLWAQDNPQWLELLNALCTH